MPEAVHRRPPLVGLGNFIFRTRNALFPIVFLVVLLLGRPLYPFGSAYADRLLDAVGIALALAGQMIRALTISIVYVTRGGLHGKVHADELVQHGLFAHTRNPLYVGNLSVVLGLVLVLNSLPGYALGLPFFLLSYWSLMQAEETFLGGKFGDVYRDYCRRVPRFFPSLRGLSETLSAQPLDWMRSVRKEYGQAYTWISVVIGLLWWERVAVEGLDAVNGQPYLIAWALVTVVYVITRTLKKTQRLG